MQTSNKQTGANDMTNSLSQYATAGEARVVRKLVKAAIAAGYSVSVNDGEEWTVKRSTSTKVIFDALATTGEDTIRISAADPSKTTGWHGAGSFCLIYGNDPSGEEILADYTDNEVCEALYKAAYRVKTTI
tara:strand:+ start:420 stop:812 length:393 start_codon:yes stop_codon:yes gene_type:complete